MAWKRTFSREAFVAAWESSSSVNEVMRTLGMNISGGSHRSICRLAEELGLAPIVWRNQSAAQQSLEGLLVENSPTSTSGIHRRLRDAGVLDARCAICGLTEWRGQPIPLELDHINGDNRDHRLFNLRLLCRNCHGQTPTFGSKNRRTKPAARLCGCGAETRGRGAVRCLACHQVYLGRKARSEHRLPSVAEVVAEIERVGFLAAGVTYGVSDNGLRKVLRRAGVDPMTVRTPARLRAEQKLRGNLAA